MQAMKLKRNVPTYVLGLMIILGIATGGLIAVAAARLTDQSTDSASMSTGGAIRPADSQLPMDQQGSENALAGTEAESRSSLADGGAGLLPNVRMFDGQGDGLVDSVDPGIATYPNLRAFLDAGLGEGLVDGSSRAAVDAGPAMSLAPVGSSYLDIKWWEENTSFTYDPGPLVSDKSTERVERYYSDEIRILEE